MDPGQRFPSAPNGHQWQGAQESAYGYRLYPTGPDRQIRATFRVNRHRVENPSHPYNDMMNPHGSMLPGNGVPNQGQARSGVQGSSGQVSRQPGMQRTQTEVEQQLQMLLQQLPPEVLQQCQLQRMNPQQLQNVANNYLQAQHLYHQQGQQGLGPDPCQIQQQMMNRAGQQNNSGISASVPTNMGNANYGVPLYDNGQTRQSMQQNLVYGPRTAAVPGAQNMGSHAMHTLGHGGNAAPMAPAVTQFSSHAVPVMAGPSAGANAIPAPPQNCEYVFVCVYCEELIPTATPSVVTMTDITNHLEAELSGPCYGANLAVVNELWHKEHKKPGQDPVENGQVKPHLVCSICKRAGRPDIGKFSNATVASIHMDKYHRNTGPVAQASPIVAISPPPVYPPPLDHGAAMGVAHSAFSQQFEMRTATPTNMGVNVGQVVSTVIEQGLEDRPSSTHARSFPMHHGGVPNNTAAYPQLVQAVARQNQAQQSQIVQSVPRHNRSQQSQIAQSVPRHPQQTVRSLLAEMIQRPSSATQQTGGISSPNWDLAPQGHGHVRVTSRVLDVPVQDAAGTSTSVPTAVIASGVVPMAESANNQCYESLHLVNNAVVEQPVRELQPQPVPEAPPAAIPHTLLESGEDSEMPAAERSTPDSSTSPRFESGRAGTSGSSSAEAEVGDQGRRTDKRKQSNPAKRTERAASVVIIEQPAGAARRDDMDDLSCDSDGNPADQDGSVEKLSPRQPRIKKEPVPIPAAQHFDEQIHSAVGSIMEPAVAEAVAEQTVDHPMVAERSPSTDSAKENAKRADTQSVSAGQAAAGRPPLRETVKNATRQKIITRRWICKCGDLKDSRDEYKRHFAKHLRGAARSRSASKWLCPREQCNYQADDEDDFSAHIARHILLQHMYRVQMAKREQARLGVDPSPAKAV